VSKEGGWVRLWPLNCLKDSMKDTSNISEDIKNVVTKVSLHTHIIKLDYHNFESFCRLWYRGIIYANFT